MLYLTTYFDKNYLSRGLVLYDSLKEQGDPFELYILCLDLFTLEYFQNKAAKYPAVKTLSLDELEAADPELSASKANRSKIEFYFTLSPCLPLYLLAKYNLPHICSLDADILFLSSPLPLFDYLTDYSIIITPHKFSEELKEFIKYGLYNVSFQIFKNDETGVQCLRYWRTQCIDWCKDQPDELNNRFADQKYLDSWTERYPSKVKVLDDSASGLAPWNLNNYQLSKIGDRFYSNDVSIIFYHFHHFKFFSRRWASNGLNKYRVKPNKIIGKIYLTYWNKLIRYNSALSFLGNDFNRFARSENKWVAINDENFVYCRWLNNLMEIDIPPNKQEGYNLYFNKLSFPISEEIHATTLSLPISYATTASDVKTVAESINNFF